MWGQDASPREKNPGSLSRTGLCAGGSGGGVELTEVPTQPSHAVNSSVRNVLGCLTGLHSEEPGMAESVTDHVGNWSWDIQSCKCPGLELEKNIGRVVFSFQFFYKHCVSFYALAWQTFAGHSLHLGALPGHWACSVMGFLCEEFTV